MGVAAASAERGSPPNGRGACWRSWAGAGVGARDHDGAPDEGAPARGPPGAGVAGGSGGLKGKDRGEAEGPGGASGGGGAERGGDGGAADSAARWGVSTFRCPGSAVGAGASSSRMLRTRASISSSVSSSFSEAPDRGAGRSGSRLCGSGRAPCGGAGSSLGGSGRPGSARKASGRKGSGRMGSGRMGSSLTGSILPASARPGSDLPDSDLPDSDLPCSDFGGSGGRTAGLDGACLTGEAGASLGRLLALGCDDPLRNVFSQARAISLVRPLWRRRLAAGLSGSQTRAARTNAPSRSRRGDRLPNSAAATRTRSNSRLGRSSTPGAWSAFIW